MTTNNASKEMPDFMANWPPALKVWMPALCLLGVTFAVAIALHWAAIVTAIDLWATRSTYNHGFLILPIAFYLIWDRRHALQIMTPQPILFGALGVFVASAVWLFARSAGLMEGEHFVIIALFQGIVLTLLGWRLYWAMLLPMNYLWLMVPTGTLFFPFLQGIATILTDFLLHLFGFVTYSEGFVILAPTGAYIIAEGCSGLNFILSTLALAPLYATFIYSSMRKRIIAVAIALVVSVIANAVRIFAIIAIAEATDRKIDIVDDHLLYGWGFLPSYLYCWDG